MLRINVSNFNSIGTQASLSILTQRYLRKCEDTYSILQNKYICNYEDSFGVKILREDCALRSGKVPFASKAKN